jgi:hypothetical protein
MPPRHTSSLPSSLHSSRRPRVRVRALPALAALRRRENRRPGRGPARRTKSTPAAVPCSTAPTAAQMPAAAKIAPNGGKRSRRGPTACAGFLALVRFSQGTPGRTRTCGLLVRKSTLTPAGAFPLVPDRVFPRATTGYRSDTWHTDTIRSRRMPTALHPNCTVHSPAIFSTLNANLAICLGAPSGVGHADPRRTITPCMRASFAASGSLSPYANRPHQICA